MLTVTVELIRSPCVVYIKCKQSVCIVSLLFPPVIVTFLDCVITRVYALALLTAINKIIEQLPRCDGF